MTLEVEVKFVIGDKVKVLNPGDRFSAPFLAYVSGYVIHTRKTGTKVYYTVDRIMDNGNTISVDTCDHKRRYGTVVSDEELAAGVKNLLTSEYYSKWDGKLPVYMMDSSGVVTVIPTP